MLTLGPVRLTWEHKFSSFNDRLIFPTATFTGPFTPADDSGYGECNPPPSGPAPPDVAAGNYSRSIFPSPNQPRSDSLSLELDGFPQAQLQRQRKLHALTRHVYQLSAEQL